MPQPRGVTLHVKHSHDILKSVIQGYLKKEDSFHHRGGTLHFESRTLHCKMFICTTFWIKKKLDIYFFAVKALMGGWNQNTNTTLGYCLEQYPYSGNKASYLGLTYSQCWCMSSNISLKTTQMEWGPSLWMIDTMWELGGSISINASSIVFSKLKLRFVPLCLCLPIFLFFNW